MDIDFEFLTLNSYHLDIVYLPNDPLLSYYTLLIDDDLRYDPVQSPSNKHAASKCAYNYNI